MSIFPTLCLLPRFFFSRIPSRYASFRDVILDKHELQVKYMRSSGPGGQSVNKTSSKAQVRILLSSCSSIDQFILNNINQRYSNMVNKAGQLVARSQIHKAQDANLKECIERLQKIIYDCSLKTEERSTEVTEEQREKWEWGEKNNRRLESKRSRSNIKKSRQNLKKLL